MVNRRVAVLICYKDRPSEVAMLLESLYFQTYQNFDIFMLDDQSGTPLQTYHFFNCIVNRMIYSNHKMFIHKTEFPHGVSKARQKIVDIALSSGRKYDFFMRVDDDVVLEKDFIERLINVIDQGYDLASGVTPPMHVPIFVREPKYIGEIINRVILDNNGNYVFNGDDCGMLYTESVILPAHHFRSSALYKVEIHDKVNYLPTKLTKHGFREEQIFSYKMLMSGLKIGVDTGAIAWHQMTPSGGERFSDSAQLIQINQGVLEEFTKENKEELNRIFKQPELTKQELMKETNLARI